MNNHISFAWRTLFAAFILVYGGFTIALGFCIKHDFYYHHSLELIEHNGRRFYANNYHSNVYKGQLKYISYESAREGYVRLVNPSDFKVWRIKNYPMPKGYFELLSFWPFHLFILVFYTIFYGLYRACND